MLSLLIFSRYALCLQVSTYLPRTTADRELRVCGTRLLLSSSVTASSRHRVFRGDVGLIQNRFDRIILRFLKWTSAAQYIGCLGLPASLWSHCNSQYAQIHIPCLVAVHRLPKHCVGEYRVSSAHLDAYSSKHPPRHSYTSVRPKSVQFTITREFIYLRTLNQLRRSTVY